VQHSRGNSNEEQKKDRTLGLQILIPLPYQGLWDGDRMEVAELPTEEFGVSSWLEVKKRLATVQFAFPLYIYTCFGGKELLCR
jgi:hypothetical protein